MNEPVGSGGATLFKEGLPKEVTLNQDHKHDQEVNRQKTGEGHLRQRVQPREDLRQLQAWCVCGTCRKAGVAGTEGVTGWGCRR